MFSVSSRNVSDQDSHGWTVLLREGPDRYECAGYDFVLDLISEMEIPPGFPFGRSHHLVFSDKMRTGRRNHVKDMYEVFCFTVNWKFGLC